MTFKSEDILQFLSKIETNNNRDWFNENKPEFKTLNSNFKDFSKRIFENLNKHDQVDRFKIFRIYRDVRFSKNKLPYKTHFASSFHRLKPELRGGYYFHIKPGNESFIAAGFWGPEKEDLHRIRKELEMDSDEFKQIIEDKHFVATWGKLRGDELKTAPRNFDKNHIDINLIKKKQFFFAKYYTDKEITSKNLLKNIDESYQAIKPFFNYMSEILTTNLNGESLI